MASQVTIALVVCILLTGLGFALVEVGEVITQLANSISMGV